MSSITDPAPTGQHHPSDGEVILGVDTHKDTHTAAVLDHRGALLGTRTFATTRRGYADLLDWATGHGRIWRAAVEGSHSYGAALTRHLHTTGTTVIEVNQPDRHHRRRRGKTDTLDAESAARAVLSGRCTALAKTGTGPVERIRLFHLARTSAVKARTQAINQLKAILVGADPALRETLTGLGTTRLVRACAELTCDTLQDTLFATCYTLRLLARRIIALTDQADELTQHITRAVTAHHPALLQQHGVGPDTAAALLLAAGDNPHRITTEARFAALCGTNPIPASSGNTHRHRLNRGGDRQANRALYTIALCRLSNHQPTRDYMTRRTSEGKTRRETIRCLKRAIARQLYPLITHPATP
jgi:transposase